MIPQIASKPAWFGSDGECGSITVLQARCRWQKEKSKSFISLNFLHGILSLAAVRSSCCQRGYRCQRVRRKQNPVAELQVKEDVAWNIVPKRRVCGPSWLREYRKKLEAVLGPAFRRSKRSNQFDQEVSSSSQIACDAGETSGPIDHDERIAQDASAWALHLRGLVDIEWQEEKDTIQQRLTQWSLERLVDEGLTIADLQAEVCGVFSGMLQVSFKSVGGGPIPPHEFQIGDHVIVNDGRPLASRQKAQVVSSTTWTITCCMRSPPNGKGPWRLDRGPNETAYQRVLKSLQQLEKCEFQKDLLQILLEIDVDEHNTTAQIPLEVSWAGLNDAQARAVHSVEAKRIALIQGPPGCGKTHTAYSPQSSIQRQTAVGCCRFQCGCGPPI